VSAHVRMCEIHCVLHARSETLRVSERWEVCIPIAITITRVAILKQAKTKKSTKEKNKRKTDNPQNRTPDPKQKG
jgi:hypothetical protein